MEQSMIRVVNALDTRGNSRHHLVGNGVEPLSQLTYRQVRAKNLHSVAYLAVNVGDVNHADVHTDVSNVGSGLPVYQTIALAVAQMPIQSIGISYRNSCDAGRTAQLPLPAIADSLCWRHVAKLQDSGAKCGNGVDCAVVDRIDAIEPKPEAYHLVVPLGEALDACAVADMPQETVAESLAQLA